MDGDTLYNKYHNTSVIKNGFLMDAGVSVWPFNDFIALSNHLLMRFGHIFGSRVGGQRFAPPT
eukprot:8099568-Heterocapsa_arctica.AAC.1